MMTFTEVQNEFFIYLNDNGVLSKGTSKSYAKDYLPPIIESVLSPWFRGQGFEDPFLEFNRNKSNSVQRSLIIAISNCLIEKEIQTPQIGKNVKTIKNWRSGIRAFFAFIENEGYFFNSSIKNAKLKDELIHLGGIVYYNTEDLFQIFMSRLTTQDRAYANMIYPARLLNLIFNNSSTKEDYQNLLSNILLKTKFIIENGKSISLEKLSKLKIDYRKKKGNVEICFSGKWYGLFTENPTVSPVTYEAIQADGLDDLSLDHDTPLQNLLDSSVAITDYCQLTRLSMRYAAYVNRETVSPGDYLRVKDIRNFKKHSSRCYASNKTQFDDQFINDLLNDLKKLYSEINLTVMLKSFNSSKGKNISIS